MESFVVTIERLERRKVRVAGHSIDRVRDLMRDVLPEGARVLDVQPLGLPDVGTGRAMLDHLLSRDFMALNGQPAAAVETWVLDAIKGAGRRDEANATLALAGLRVTEDRDGLPWLWVGSANSIPLLAEWVLSSGRAPSGLLPALQALPGATTPRGMTFAGLKSRAVGLPFSSVFPTGDA